MPNTTVRAAAEGMPATNETMTFMDLEPLICDADNMVDVLVDMMQIFATVPDGNFVLTQGEGDRLFFIATIAEQMTRKVKDAYYEALEDKSDRH